MSGRIIRQDFGGINNLAKALGDGHVVRVGVLSGKTNRRGQQKKSGDGLSNADVGAIHEFGSFSRGIPARSWLRMPIEHETETIVEDVAPSIPSLVQDGNAKKFLKWIGIACEAAIQRAFASAGFGTWRALKAATARRKRSSSPLIDTGQLRRSVASEVGSPT